MKLRYKVLLGVGIALNLFVVTIVGASAASGGGALEGLKETFGAILKAFEMYLAAIP
mgnify:CR=1 FL=1